jgi:peptidoglycan/LPS O-acetylase OafA/YrhL
MRYEYIQFARGYAIFTILLYHVLQRLALTGIAAKAIILGGTGVHLFFFLSGFGLMLSKNTGTPLAFYRRRLVKVWLPYVLALSISLLLAFAWNIFPDRGAAWLAGVAGYQMFFESYIESFGGHFWFISAIIQFYLVFPLLKWGIGQRKSPVLFALGCLAVSIVWWMVVYVSGKGVLRVWNSFFLQFLWEFGLGMALAKFLANTETGNSVMQMFSNCWQPKYWYWWLAGGVIGTGIMAVMILKMGTLGPVFNDIPALAGYGMLSVGVWLFAARYLPAIGRFFSWIGDFSFSLYLSHIFVLELFLRVLTAARFNFNIFWIPLFVLIAIVVALGFERLSNGIQRAVTPT